MAQITETIVAPIWPQIADGTTVFDQKSDALAPQLIAIQNSMNTYATQANAVRDEVNGFQLSASASAAAAANAQTAAKGFRDEAEGFRDDSQAILDSNTTIAAAVQSAAGLPSLTGKAGQFLRVNETEDGVLWDNPVIGTNELPTYINNSASGNIDLDFSIYSAFELNLSGDITLTPTNIRTDSNRSTATLSIVGADKHSITHGFRFDSDADYTPSESSGLNELFDLSVIATAINTHQYNGDGTKLWLLSNGTDSLYQLTLATPYRPDLGYTLDGSFSVAAQNTSPTSFILRETRLIVVGAVGSELNQYTLTTSEDITDTVTFDGVYVVTEGTSPGGIDFDPTGTIMIVSTGSNDFIHQYTLTTALDITDTVTFDGSYDASAIDTSINSCRFIDGGLGVTFCGFTNDSIFSLTLDSAYDITGAVILNDTYSTATYDGSPSSFCFCGGSMASIVGLATNKIYDVQILTPNSIDTSLSTLELIQVNNKIVARKL